MKFWKGRITHVLLAAFLAAGALFLYGCGKKDQLEPCTVKIYDETGQLIQTIKKDAYDFETEVYDIDGKLTSKFEMDRDSDGRLLERRVYDDEGLDNIEKFEYKGRKATAVTYLSEDGSYDNTSKWHTCKWEFDSGNRPVKFTRYEGENFIYKLEYERDSYGNNKKITLYMGSSEELKVVWEQKFDITYKDGHAVRSEDEKIIYDSDGQVDQKERTHREFEY